MGPFRFRLGRLLEWYRKQAQLEESRLAACNAALIRARSDAAAHRERRQVLESEFLSSASVSAPEFEALGSWRRQAKQSEHRLDQVCKTASEATARQSLKAQEVRRRFRLIEKLRYRQLAEHEVEIDREIEALASDAYLAGFARAISSNS